MAVDLDQMSSAQLRAHRIALNAQLRAERAKLRDERKAARDAARGQVAAARAARGQERAAAKSTFLAARDALRANRGSMSPEEYQTQLSAIQQAYQSARDQAKTNYSAARQQYSQARNQASQNYQQKYGDVRNRYSIMRDDAKLRFRYVRGNEAAARRGLPAQFASYGDFLNAAIQEEQNRFNQTQAQIMQQAQASGQSYTPKQFTSRYAQLQQLYSSPEQYKQFYAGQYTPPVTQQAQAFMPTQGQVSYGQPTSNIPMPSTLPPGVDPNLRQNAQYGDIVGYNNKNQPIYMEQGIWPWQDASYATYPGEAPTAPLPPVPSQPSQIVQNARQAGLPVGSSSMQPGSYYQPQQPQQPVLTPQQQLATMLMPQIGYANQNYQQPAFNPYLPSTTAYNPYSTMYSPLSNPYAPPTGTPLQLPQEQRQEIPEYLQNLPQGMSNRYF